MYLIHQHQDLTYIYKKWQKFSLVMIYVYVQRPKFSTVDHSQPALYCLLLNKSYTAIYCLCIALQPNSRTLKGVIAPWSFRSFYSGHFYSIEIYSMARQLEGYVGKRAYKGICTNIIYKYKIYLYIGDVFLYISVFVCLWALADTLAKLV